jgi:hAT family C-terminal dimerisation region
MSEVAVVRGEFDLWTEHWNKEDNKDKKLINNTAIAALNACPSTFYPNINKLLRILATLPSSTAEPERVFSKVTKTLSAV